MSKKCSKNIVIFSINFAFVAKHQKSKQKLAAILKPNVFDSYQKVLYPQSSIIITDNKHMDKQFAWGSKAINPLIKTLFEKLMAIHQF